MLRTANALASTSRVAAKRTPAIASSSFSTFPAASSRSTPSRTTPRRPRLAALKQSTPQRTFSLSATTRQAEPLNQEFNLTDVERVTDEVDVCIVGAGPAGLSAAIRLMKKAQEEEKEIRVVVLEKGSEVGKSLPPLLATYPFRADPRGSQVLTFSRELSSRQRRSTN